MKHPEPAIYLFVGQQDRIIEKILQSVFGEVNSMKTTVTARGQTVIPAKIHGFHFYIFSFQMFFRIQGKLDHPFQKFVSRQT